MHSPRMTNADSVVRSPTPGDSLFVTAHVVDGRGNPVQDTESTCRHASPVGLYENQDANQAEMNMRGKFTTDANGRFWFRTIRMVGYPIPPTVLWNVLLRAQGRHPYRPAHLHALMVKPGYKVLISQVYDPRDPRIDSDVQFGVTKALIGEFRAGRWRTPSERCERGRPLVLTRLHLRDGSR